MKRVCCLALCLASLLALAAEEAKTPRTDLYGDPLPPGAVMRLGTTRLRHYMADVVFSKDGKQLISCGRDGEVRVWEAASGKLVRRTRLACNRSNKELSSIPVLSPKGSLVAVWQKNTGCLCDARTGAVRGRLPEGVFRDDRMLVFAPNEEILAAQQTDKQNKSHLLIWDIKSSKIRYTFLSPSFFLRLKALAFSTDSRQLAALTGNLENNLYVWDTGSGKERAKTTVRGGSALAWSPDGKTLAVGVTSSSAIRLLDADTLRERQVIEAPGDRKVRREMVQLAFSPDGLLLAGTYTRLDGFLAEEGIHLWNVKTRQEIQQLPNGYENRFVFAPDGKTLAFREFGSAIRLWDVAAKREVHPLRGQDYSAWRLAVSADGKQLASSYNSVFVWDTTSGRLRSRCQTRTGISFFFFSPDGSRLITGDPKGRAQIWDPSHGKELQRLTLDSTDSFMNYPAAGLSEAGRHLLLVTAKQVPRGDKPPTAELSIWDLAAGKRLVQRPPRLETRDIESPLGPFDGMAPFVGLAHAAFSADGTCMTEWRDGRVGLVEVASGTLLASLPRGIGEPLVFSPDGRLLAAAVVQPRMIDAWMGNVIKGIAVMETASGEEIFRKDNAGMRHFTFAPEGRMLIGADKQQLWAWNTDTGDLLYRQKWPEGVSAVDSLAALPGGRVATGHADSDILNWDLQPAPGSNHKPKHALEGKELAALWADLAGDARKAHRALAALTAARRKRSPS